MAALCWMTLETMDAAPTVASNSAAELVTAAAGPEIQRGLHLPALVGVTRRPWHAPPVLAVATVSLAFRLLVGVVGFMSSQGCSTA